MDGCCLLGAFAQQIMHSVDLIKLVMMMMEALATDRPDFRTHTEDKSLKLEIMVDRIKIWVL
jgi:hypothetical protein